MMSFKQNLSPCTSPEALDQKNSTTRRTQEVVETIPRRERMRDMLKKNVSYATQPYKAFTADLVGPICLAWDPFPGKP